MDALGIFRPVDGTHDKKSYWVIKFFVVSFPLSALMLLCIWFLITFDKPASRLMQTSR